MKQVLVKKGCAVTEEVPAPIVSANEVLVQVHYSCISPGTELSGIESSGVPLYKKALEKPQNVKKVLAMLRTQGLRNTVASIKNKLNAGSITGYSAAGTVLEAGSEIQDIKQGDRVACAGAGIANHAEFISVPRNLLVKLPEGLSFDMASTVALGSIAMQGVRRASPGLGEHVAVIGLGMLGQLTVQMLKLAGCKVLGTDIDQKRIQTALSLGLDKGLNPENNDVVEETLRFFGGCGVDSVIVTAATESDILINQAMKMCRRKGKVIIVGAVRLNLEREEFYKKELDLLISTSYGPGRYDAAYEQKGQDYPYAYVRWTENRNMQEYLQFLKDGKITLKPLIEKIYPIEDAASAYAELKTGNNKPLIILLEYSKDSIPERKIIVSKAKALKGKLNVGLIGAGGFAKGMLLPGLQKLENAYNIYAVSSKTGNNAKATAGQYNASYATTDFEEILKDKNVDLVVISTRHNLHARMALAAAKAGKAVFLEKPMALNRQELKELVQVLEETKVPFMVGFNRRFSPFVRKTKEIVSQRINPMIINYRMNAGFIPREHWVHTEEGGGRNIGEACHIYDLFNFLTESEVESISAASIDPKTEQYGKNDNFTATVKYTDGSICNLIYTSLGNTEVPKEQMEIYVDGKIIHLNDYKKLEVFGTRFPKFKTKNPEKGHYEELSEFAKSINESNGYPIPLWQLIQATEISFIAEENLRAPQP